MRDEVGRSAQYESFADEFLDHAVDGFYNAHYDRPACLGLLGEVAGCLQLLASHVLADIFEPADPTVFERTNRAVVDRSFHERLQHVGGQRC